MSRVVGRGLPGAGVLTTLTLVSCVGAATVGGVFYAFSTFVMRALALLPPAQGVAAMQRINVTVLNPLFLVPFLGVGVTGAWAAGLALSAGAIPLAAWLGGGSAAYVLGSVGVTVAFNVPRNERLRVLDAESARASEYWPEYVRRWTLWNHVRTLACLASAGCFGYALRLV